MLKPWTVVMRARSSYNWRLNNNIDVDDDNNIRKRGLVNWLYM